MPEAVFTWVKSKDKEIVIVHRICYKAFKIPWIPAFAGMTDRGKDLI